MIRRITVAASAIVLIPLTCAALILGGVIIADLAELLGG